jgi:hypothetical protein
MILFFVWVGVKNVCYRDLVVNEAVLFATSCFASAQCDLPLLGHV